MEEEDEAALRTIAFAALKTQYTAAEGSRLRHIIESQRVFLVQVMEQYLSSHMREGMFRGEYYQREFLPALYNSAKYLRIDSLQKFLEHNFEGRLEAKAR